MSKKAKSIFGIVAAFVAALAFAGSAMGDEVTLSWSHPDPDRVDVYRVYRFDWDAGSASAELAVETTRTTETMALEPGAYGFFVTAANSAGESPRSNVASATVGGIPPATPGGLRVTVTVEGN